MKPTDVAEEWAKDFAQKGAMEHAGYWRAIGIALAGKTTTWIHQSVLLDALQYAEVSSVTSSREDIRRESIIMIEALREMLER